MYTIYTTNFYILHKRNKDSSMVQLCSMSLPQDAFDSYFKLTFVY